MYCATQSNRSAQDPSNLWLLGVLALGKYVLAVEEDAVSVLLVLLQTFYHSFTAFLTTMPIRGDTIRSNLNSFDDRLGILCSFSAIWQSR